MTNSDAKKILSGDVMTEWDAMCKIIPDSFVFGMSFIHGLVLNKDYDSREVREAVVAQYIDTHL